jgi:sec-independent protein translocase protein TatA
MIPGLPSIGGGEILILLAIVLLFFGAKRIPELARSLGKGTREFRKGMSDGANKAEALVEEDHKEKDEKERSLEEEAREEKSQTEAETARPKQQS